MSTREHEIGNLLGVVIGNAQLLAEEGLDGDAKEMVQDLLSASIRLRALLQLGAGANGLSGTRAGS